MRNGAWAIAILRGQCAMGWEVGRGQWELEKKPWDIGRSVRGHICIQAARAHGFAPKS